MTSTRATPTTMTVFRKKSRILASVHAWTWLSKLQCAGSENGEARISLVVLSDDSTTHRNGTMTMIDQKARSTWEVASTVLSPPVHSLRLSVTTLSSGATAVIRAALVRGLR